MIVLHLKTTHDSNGNPRRLYLPLVDSYTERCILAVVQEGYSGTSKLAELFPDEWLNLIPVIVTTKEYREWIAYGKEYDLIHYG